ncbi:gliding motility-associated C-terminal domain-containing protein [Fulvivirga sp.]|uniref:T9SS type B sorting domain-containing protein n=1 Tax=Fulvivirga sp. TaxID=1931237 RepID=UPI0032EC2647
MKKLFFISAFVLAVGMVSQAQEICDDGIDNDGDGFIDCFDPDCANSSVCDGFYTGNDASCEAVPSAFPAFSLTLDFKSPNKSANHIGRIAIGDLDRDGIPEIATQNRYTDEVFLLNGNDGSVKATATVDNPRWRISMANVEDDDCGEVFAVDYNGGDYRIVALDCNLNELWKSENRDKDPVHLGYADFDQDGKVEMYYKDEIRDPVNGTRLVKGNDGNWDNINGGPVAVNILGDSKLELVSGGKIYSVNLGSRTADAGSLTEIATMPIPYAVKHGENATSVADYNLDGFLDVIVSGKDDNGITTVFFWDVQNNTVKTFNDPLTNAETGSDDYLKGWKGGTGRLNIGDMDGDGQLNVSFVSGRYLYALDENWDLFWRVVINEETSGYTGCTLFDFNGDGKTEVVYRDEQWLYIIKGDDGTVFTQQRCISRTNVEYPIVADVDADGSTEICVPCGTNDTDAWNNFNDLSYSENSQVRVFKSGGEPWVPARRLWNQHGYFNVNVNDDLSIPRVQQDHHLVWSTGTCTVGPNRPLNGFLNQSPFLNSEGCPTYAAPDLAIVDNSLIINQPDCPDQEFTISFDYENIGDVELSGDVPVTFYNGNPILAGATKLGTEILTLSKLGVGQVETALNLEVTGPGSPFTLFVVLNDDGSTVPSPITLPNTNILECEYNNNIVSGLVNPNPFPLSTEKTDNITCSGGSVPANGSARAFRLVGGAENTSDYNFFWFNGTDATGTADFTGAIYTGLSAGTYSVFATHKTAFCNSDTVQVVINDIPTTVTAAITENQSFDNCKNPNGELQVVVNGGEPAANYDYEWYVGNTVGGGLVISKSNIATDLDPGIYTVLVTDKLTGCQTIESEEVQDLSNIPVVSATAVDIVCSDATSGSVSANVGGLTTGFTFKWYRGTSVKPSPDFTGATVNTLNKGKYTVVAINDAFSCSSLPVTVTIDQTTAPVISSTSSTEMNSCDSSSPNGSVSVTFPGTASDFTISWFRGQNTNNANLVGTGATVENLAKGIYTVRLTDNVTGCSTTDEATIVDNVVIPTLSFTKTDVTQCNPFNGSITASVSVDTPADYTFSWYEGTTVKATPDFTETGNILSNLAPGEYTFKAVNNNRSCNAAPVTVTILDNSPAININQNKIAEVPPSDCNANNGELSIEVSRAGNTSGFELEWYNGFDAIGTPLRTVTGVSTDALTGISVGVYTVLARDLDTGCESIDEFELEFINLHTVTLTPIDADQCSPENGQLQINLDTKTLDHGDFIIEVYEGTDLTQTPVETINATPGVTVPTDYFSSNTLSSIEYTVIALNTGAGFNNCSSVPKRATIGTLVTNPTIVTGVTDDFNCDNTLGIAHSGFAEITDLDGTGIVNAADFTIEWYAGQTTSGSPIATGLQANNLESGIYTVSVTSNVNGTSSLGCTSITEVNIIDSSPLTTVDVIATNIVDCLVDGSLNNGSATAIAFEDGIDNTGSYNFTWTDNGGAAADESSLPQGNYFVSAINPTNGCSSETEFVVEDETFNDPEITLLDFQNPTRCLQLNNVLGELFTEASGGGASYSYNWFAGTSATGTPLVSDANIVDLVAGDYTVEVTNNTTLCRSTETYELVLETSEVDLTGSATPLTDCSNNNGTVFATVTSGGSNNYNYIWTDVSGASIGTGKDVTGLNVGDYTVVATDISDAFCQNTITVTVTNEQIIPNVIATEVAPITVCDITKADGVASASVDGSFIGYTFDWFEGRNTSGTPVYTGTEFFGLQALEYTVRATNNLTNCFNEQTITISSDIEPVPNPDVTLIANDTHCVIDNGALSAAVNGNTSNYTFDWYLGTTVSSTIENTGEFYEDLAQGLYSVTATSLVTGCVSEPVTGEVQEILVFPAFEFEIGNASCNNDNGYALMRLTNEVEIDEVIWTDLSNNVDIAVGPNLTEVPVGMYHVVVQTAQQCSAEADVTIGTEVNPFNGISRNGDNENAFFKIECIENFPQNVVKIFNRAGTLVFEEEGYDNSAKLFDGSSNKGINPMGRNLPDGTYFYVIDKRDGSKALSGYLEIVN